MPNEQKPAEAPCEPVGYAFGNEVSPQELTTLSSEFPEEVQHVSETLKATHARSSEDLETGTAAARAIESIGCTACELSSVCAVSSELKKARETGEEDKQLQDAATMLASAPQWLTDARLHSYGATPEELRERTGTPEQTKQAIESGELDLNRLMAGVTNQPGETYTAAELPELQDINISPDEPLFSHNIQAKGNTFTVIDADRNTYTQDTSAERGILGAKLLERMKEIGPDGKPQISTDDGKMQKSLKSLPGVHELRMGGKNRMYFTEASQPDGSTRLVLLGSHGGDTKTQQKFIDSLKAMPNQPATLLPSHAGSS